MKILKLEIPDGEYVEFCDFMCEVNQYQEQIHIKASPEPITNPETKEDFAIRHLEKNVFDNFVLWKKNKQVEILDIKTEIRVKK